MSQFRFRLQKVLDIAIHKENEKQIAYAKARGFYTEQLQKVEDIKNDITKYSDPKYYKTVAESRLSYTYVSTMRTKLYNEEKVLKELEHVMVQSQNELKNAHIEKRKFEILKEKRKEEFELNQQLVEDKFIAEISQHVWMRSRKNQKEYDMI